MKKLLPVFLALSAVCLLQGCDHDDAAQAASSPTQKKLHLAFIANSAGEYWSIVNLGCDIGSQQLGDVSVDFHFPAERTVEAQQELLTNLVAAGVDGIAISPIDGERQKDALNDAASKTLLICADSDAESSKRVGYVGSDNVAAGKQAAELIKAALPQGGKIVALIGYGTAQNSKERMQGIQSGLAGSNIEIVETLADGQSSTVGQKNAGDALAKYSDLAGMVGISGYHGPAILTAVRAAGKAGKVKIICFDDNADTLAGIVAGDIYGTIAQNPFQIGKQSIAFMEKQLRGDKSQLTGSKLLTSTRALTQDNVGSFQAERKAILLHLNGSAM